MRWGLEETMHVKCQVYAGYPTRGTFYCIQWFQISRILLVAFVGSKTMATFKLRCNAYNMKCPFRVWSSSFRILTKLYDHWHKWIQNISSSPKAPISFNQLLSIPLLPCTNQPLATNNLLSVSVDLLILDISYKWSYSIWPFVSGFFHLT